MKQTISLNGVIDMHVHTTPDVCQRTYNDLELTAASIRAGQGQLSSKVITAPPWRVQRCATPITEWHLTATPLSCTADWL